MINSMEFGANEILFNLSIIKVNIYNESIY